MTATADYGVIAPLHEVKGYYIGGVFQRHKGMMENVFSSIELGGDETYIGQFPHMSQLDALRVIESAAAAYNDGNGEWPMLDPMQRVEYIKDFAHHLKARRSRIVDLLMFEICKSQSDAEKEFDRTIQYILDTCKEYQEMCNTTTIQTGGFNVSTNWESVGVGLCMGPSNYPFNELFTSAIPMMISGNVVVVQHARRGILFNSIIEEVANECLPAGTYQYLWGSPKDYLSGVFATNKLSLFSFIGGTKTADAIMRYSPNLANLKVVLGLGAKNAAVITEDANIDLAVKESVTGMLSYMGQRCTAHKMTFVHRSVATSFVEKLIEKLDSLKAGLPWEDGVFYTQLPTVEDSKRMSEYVTDAQEKGAETTKIGLWEGSNIPESYFAPVILTDVNETMRIYHEEQFGPVVPIVIYDDIQEVIDWHKKSEFGQQVAIFSDSFITSKQKSTELLKKFQKLVARVCINHACMRGPDSVLFTGRKNSGLDGLSLRIAIEKFAFLVVNSEKI